MSDENAPNPSPEPDDLPAFLTETKPAPPDPYTTFAAAQDLLLVAVSMVVALGFFNALPDYPGLVQCACLSAIPVSALYAVRALSELPRKIFSTEAFAMVGQLTGAASLGTAAGMWQSGMNRYGVRIVGVDAQLIPVTLFCVSAVFGLIAMDVRRGRMGVGSVLLVIAALICGVALPRQKLSRERANTRACFSNQKTISGAIEMYALDKNLKAPPLNTSFFEKLKSGGYLRSTPQDPGQGPDTQEHYRTTTVGNGIECTVHGPVRPIE